MQHVYDSLNGRSLAVFRADCSGSQFFDKCTLWHDTVTPISSAVPTNSVCLCRLPVSDSLRPIRKHQPQWVLCHAGGPWYDTRPPRFDDNDFTIVMQNAFMDTGSMKVHQLKAELKPDSTHVSVCSEFYFSFPLILHAGTSLCSWSCHVVVHHSIQLQSLCKPPTGLKHYYGLACASCVCWLSSF